MAQLENVKKILLVYSADIVTGNDASDDTTIWMALKENLLMQIQSGMLDVKSQYDEKNALKKTLFTSSLVVPPISD